jgi:hypothetical protein
MKMTVILGRNGKTFLATNELPRYKFSGEKCSGVCRWQKDSVQAQNKITPALVGQFQCLMLNTCGAITLQSKNKN